MFKKKKKPHKVEQMAGSFRPQGANGPSVGFSSAGLGKRRSSNNSNNSSCWISWVFFVPDAMPNVLRTLASLIVHFYPLAQATIAFPLDCLNSFQTGGPFLPLSPIISYFYSFQSDYFKDKMAQKSSRSFLSPSQ